MTREDLRQEADKRALRIAEVLDTTVEEAVELLRANRWDMALTVESFASGASTERTLQGSRRTWRRLRGRVFCATCFEEKDGGTEVISTDCGVAMCESCWGGYFSSMLSEGLRGTIRCPFPDCRTIVPLWLIEKCYAPLSEACEIIVACYRDEYMSDFVLHADNIQFCPSPECDSIIQVRAFREENTVSCKCGYEFCFACLCEGHFPAACSEARILTGLMIQTEIDQLGSSLSDVKPCSGCGILIENVRCVQLPISNNSCSSPKITHFALNH